MAAAYQRVWSGIAAPGLSQSQPMAHEFRSTRRVEFAETDLAGILHFANYYRYMEEAEHAFFRSLGLSVHGGDDAMLWGMARGRASCEFLAPLRYEDVVDIHVVVRALNDKSIEYEVGFSLDGKPIAKGEMTVVCVAKDDEGRLRATELPARVRELVEAAPAS